MIEAAENVLKDLGFYDVRVRHHEMNPKSKAQSPKWEETFNVQHSTFNAERTALARIEVGATELKRLLENGLSERVAVALKRIGYTHVTLDLQGYRRGSLNETARSGMTQHATRIDERGA